MAVPQPSWGSRGENFFRTIPITKAILLLMVVTFLVNISTNGLLGGLMAYIPFRFPNGLTGLFTYPFVIGSIITLLISGYMMYMFGGSLERSWGRRLYFVFLTSATATAALVWTVGASLFGGNPTITGPWLMVSAVIVAWAWLNPEETILLWFVLPIKAKWIGWLTIVILYFTFPRVAGIQFFILGFFALGGVAVAYAYVRYKRDWEWILRPENRARPNSRVIRHPSSTFTGSLTRPWREWQRRRRIAHLQRTLLIEEEDAGQTKD
jgi:membrane associated rhomboid family serine protease